MRGVPQGCVKLLDFSLASIGWGSGLGRGGAFLLVSPLLGPLPTRCSRGEDGELDAALGTPGPQTAVAAVPAGGRRKGERQKEECRMQKPQSALEGLAEGRCARPLGGSEPPQLCPGPGFAGGADRAGRIVKS